jgi:endonuclease YncB( thermonuclease family)
MFDAFRQSIAAVFTAVLTLATSGVARSTDLSITPTCTLPAGPVRAVTRVLDGDTLQLDDGSELRLIGALAPHAHDVGADAGAWPLAEEARQTLSHLVLGRSLALAFGGQRNDRYGRWLAHAIVEPEGHKEWVQGYMLARGMARAYLPPDNPACLSDLLDLERPAREGRLGLWTSAAYQVRSAESAQALLAYRHTFQLVQGRIAAISKARGAIYLNFAEDRRGFAAVLKRPGSALPDVAIDGIVGRTALVRGWIDRRSGPIVEIETAGQIELIDSPDSVGSIQPPPRHRKRNVPGGSTAGHE